MKYIYWVSAGVLALVLIMFFFVPAFAGKISIPSEIAIGNFAIRIYGITMASSILVGYFIGRHYSWKFGISKSEVDDIAFWITIVGFIGARIYYVIFDWQLYRNDYSEIYKIWHGGLSVYGSLIAGLIFIFFYTSKKAYSVYQLLDLMALSLPLSQAVGRFGNFFNQEAFGLPTNLPWKMYVDPINRPGNYRQYDYFHPTFLYEALVSILIFFILKKLLGKTKPGILAFVYIGLYSLGRFFIEGIRLDSSYLYGLKVDQITAVVGLVVAGIVLIRRSRQGLWGN